MTVIIGLTYHTVTYMAADSAFTLNGGGAIASLPTSKVALFEDTLIGVSGSNRILTVVNQHLSTREVPALAIPDLIEFIREKLIKHGACTQENGSHYMDGNMLIGRGGGLWLVDNHFSMSQFKDYFAIGSGAEMAIGAMAALKTTRNPEARLKKALAICEEWTPYVRRPFEIVSRYSYREVK